ncbi:MAG: WG repeat-containing protein, partial [Bacteroidota bacterium]
MNQSLKYAIIADLLQTVKSEMGLGGLGVDVHLKVQELIQKLPEDIEVDRLKTLLTPLFARNEQDQKRFYEWFEASKKRVLEAQEIETVKEPEPLIEEKEENRWRQYLYLIGAVALLLLGFVLSLLWREPTINNRFLEKEIILNRSDTLVHTQIPKREEEDTLRYISFSDGEKMIIDSVWGTYHLDTNNHLNIITRDTIGIRVDTIIIKAKYVTGVDSIHYYLSINEKRVEEEDEAELPPPSAKRPRLETKKIPHYFEPPIPDEGQMLKAKLYEEWGSTIKASLIGILALVLLFWTIWRDRKRKKEAALIRTAHKDPPYIWELGLDEPESLGMSTQAQQLSRRLRQRQLEDYQKLDVRATVNATAKNAGQIMLEYKQPSKPSEYLLLIDRYAMQDHRALFFDRLHQSFKEEEVYADRFFFEGDPRLVYNEQFPNGIRLKELQHKYSESRLLIISDAQSFFHPISGNTKPWVSQLIHWQERGILSTRALEDWGYNEEVLAQKFLILPASIQGVGKLVEQFELDDPQPLDTIIKELNDVDRSTIWTGTQLIESLRPYYSESMIRWIAACAIYPLLQWKLTLHLGKELSTEEEELLTFQNLRQMARLSWFVQGSIPDEQREILIDYLEEKGLLQSLRKSIQQLLDKSDPPEEDSVAYKKWHFNSLYNQLDLADNRKDRNQVMHQLQNYIEAGYQPDQVSMKGITKQQVGASSFADSRFSEWLFRDGEPALGWKSIWFSMPIWLILSGFILWFQPTFNLCEGEMIEFEGTVFCLNDDEDFIAYQDIRGRKMVREERSFEEIKVVQEDVNDFYKSNNEEELQVLLNITLQYALLLDSNILYKIPSFSTNDISIDGFYFDSSDVTGNDWSTTNNQQVINFQDRDTSSIGFISNSELAFIRAYHAKKILDSLSKESNLYMLVSQYIENSSIAHYNKAVKYYNLAQDNKEGLVNDANLEEVDKDLELAAKWAYLAYFLNPEDKDILNANRLIHSKDEIELPSYIQGRVLNQDSNKPLNEVEVTLDSLIVQTDAKGNYRINFPEVWDKTAIRLSFFKAGFSPVNYTHILQDRNSTEVSVVYLRQVIEPAGKEEAGKYEIFQEAGRVGLRDRASGKIILTPIYNNIELDPENGYYRVQEEDNNGNLKFKYLDENLRVIIPPIYRYIGFYHEGLVRVQQEDGYWGYLDVQGETKIPFYFFNAENFKNG